MSCGGDYEAARTGYSSEKQSSDFSLFVRAVDGGLLEISEISADERYGRGPYACLSCGHTMVPALGRTRKHHFKHKAGRPADCHKETYLHQLAKLVLFKTISEAMRKEQPYWLTRSAEGICSSHHLAHGFTCAQQPARDAVNLATEFDAVAMEAGVDGYVADILLTSSRSGGRLLIEVDVTHACEPEKISSGLPIIELKVTSELGASSLRDGLDCDAGGITLHNIPEPGPVAHFCASPCKVFALTALLYSNGKVWYADDAVGSVEERQILSDPLLVSHEVFHVSMRRSDLPLSQIQRHLSDFTDQMKAAGHLVRSCIICSHNGGQINEHDIFCLAKSRQVWMSSSAIGCTDYCVD